MQYKQNYKIWTFKNENISPKLRRYMYDFDSDVSLLYVKSYEKKLDHYEVVVWNRSEEGKDIYEKYNVPLKSIFKIEEISYKTSVINA